MPALDSAFDPSLLAGDDLHAKDLRWRCQAGDLRWTFEWVGQQEEGDAVSRDVCFWRRCSRKFLPQSVAFVLASQT